MEGYLDVTKSVIISSPAGSGKTEKLARRYISLLEAGSEVEKVLCITFTERAAAEMKQRILDILRKERPELLTAIRPKIPLMRISTIHAFCLRLLKRFSMELELDPALSVIDKVDADNLWTEALYESLMSEWEGQDKLVESLGKRGIKGWGSLKRDLDYLHGKAPLGELLIKDGALLHSPRGDGADVLALYADCLRRYRMKKVELGVLDFGDLELYAYEALDRNPEWQNILYSFDERTDHILIDEFQDTSSLQWRIIRKLTEEWRSGLGAKREAGGRPTIFLVGDEKQSIYLFRGANVGIFRNARAEFSRWLGEEYHFEEATENYRSLPAIVEFANRLFDRLMPKGAAESWRAEYSHFRAKRDGRGEVELILLDAREHTMATRKNEAEALARRINTLVGKCRIFEGEVLRPARYADMAVLLRKRTHLALFEDAMRKEGVPFVVLKGIGFYGEPEIALMRDILSFIVDPTDDHSLFCVLRSPLFSLGYGNLARLIRGDGPLIDRLRADKSDRLYEIAATLDLWAESGRGGHLAATLERILVEASGWERLRERQRCANIKKFIRMVEAYEAEGLSLIEIREKLLRQRFAGEVPKANVNADAVDAVKVMTIHAAKGLEFPIVFLPSLEESFSPRIGAIAIDEDSDRLWLCYEEDAAARKKDERFRSIKLKEEEEEKRLFYVAVTRARDRLCMLGSAKPPKVSKKKDAIYRSRLGYLEDAFGPFDGGQPFTVLRGEDLSSAPPPPTDAAEAEHLMDEPFYTGPLAYKPGRIWRDVTEDATVGRWHGKESVAVGRVIHALFEALSKGLLEVDGVKERAAQLLKAEAAMDPALLGSIIKDFERLKTSDLLDKIVLPRENAWAELPFVLERGKYVYRGRIDRLIICGGLVRVYDYKTYPVSEKEIPELKERYALQMGLYREAAEKLFKARAESYLVLTHLSLVVPVN